MGGAGAFGTGMDEPGRGGGASSPGIFGLGMEEPGNGGGASSPGIFGLGMDEPGNGSGSSPPGIFGTAMDEPGSGGGDSPPGILGTGMDEPGSAGAGSAESWGRRVAGGADVGPGSPGRWKEPMGGGPWETGGAMTGAGWAAREPGRGGERVGVAICPISGTRLAASGAGLMASVGAATGCSSGASIPGTTTGATTGGRFIASLATRPSCATTSRHRVPQAATEARLRSGARMEAGGVTGLLEKGPMVRFWPPSVNAPGFFVQNAGRSQPAADRACR